MGANIIAIVIIVVALIPPLVISIEYVLKGTYILYWEFIFRNRLDLLFEFFTNHRQTITKRRTTVDGRMIITLASKSISYRPYEYMLDLEDDSIEIIGANSKMVRMIGGSVYIAPKKIKIPKSLKSKFKESFSFIKKAPVIPDKGLPTKKEKNKKKKIKKLTSGDIERMAHNVYMLRSYNEELYKIIDLQGFKNLCIQKHHNGEKMSQKIMSEILTNKVMEYSYSQTT